MSYNRYRKRDKSEISKKSELGLENVDNYSSSDIAEVVMKDVRDYLYTPNYVSYTSTEYYPLILFKFKESGHATVEITLNKLVDGEHQVYDTIIGNFVYEKPTNILGSSGYIDCPVSFDLLGVYDSTRMLSKSSLYMIPSDSSGNIEMYVALWIPKDCNAYVSGIRHIGVNIHDYSIGSIDYASGHAFQGSIGLYFNWDFLIGDWISSKRCTVAVPIYTKTGDYVLTKEGYNADTTKHDTATINDVPFCGAYGVTVDGEDARHITVPAKHSGPSLEEAGEHDWEVLNSYKIASSDPEGLSHGENNDGDIVGVKYVPGTSSIDSSSTNFSQYGVVRLAGYNTSYTDLGSFVEHIGVMGKNSHKCLTSSYDTVISTGLFRRYSEILIDRISSLEERVEELEKKTEITYGIVTKGYNLSVASNKQSISFVGPGELDIDITPVVSLAEVKNNGDSQDVKNKDVVLIKYTSDISEDNLEVKFGDTVIERSDTTYTTLSKSLSSGTITISLKNDISLDSFTDKLITFDVEYTDGVYTATSSMNITASYTNNNTVTTGHLVDTVFSNILLSNGTLSGTGTFLSFGDTLKVSLSASDVENLENKLVLYSDKVTCTNNTYARDLDDTESLTPVSYVEVYGGEDNDIYYRKITLPLPTPSSDDITKTYEILSGTSTAFYVEVDITGYSSEVTLDKSSLQFNSTGSDSYTVIVTSKFDITPEISDTWISCVNSGSGMYTISVNPWSTTTGNRQGTVVFRNTVNQSATLNITQIAAEKYYYVSTTSGTDSDSTKLTVGTQYTYKCSTNNEENYTFYIVSNTGYEVYLDNTKILSGDSTGNEKVPITVNLAANVQSTSKTYKIEVKVSDLGNVTINCIKGNSSTVLFPTDLVFHNYNAFDPLRTEKIITVTTSNPDNITISSSNDFMVAKIFSKQPTHVNIHVYPKSVSSFSSDIKSTLTIYESGVKIDSAEFTFEQTVSTVGKYFNVSDTILSYTKNDTSDVSLTLSAFSMAGTSALSLSVVNTSDITISSPTIKTYISGSSYSYKLWTIVIPKSKAPVSGTPWILKVSNKCSDGETRSIYVSIYENSDVSKSTSSTERITAFGHISIMDGCEIMPILYKKYTLTCNIGGSTKTCDYISILHDITNIIFATTVGGTQNKDYWAFKEGNLSFSTCDNCGSIVNTVSVANSSGLGAIVAVTTLEYSKQTSNGHIISSSLDLPIYTNMGSSYTTVYGSECITSDTQGTNSMIMPNSECTVGPQVLSSTSSSYYTSVNASSLYSVVPPDWKITTTSASSTSIYGYVNLPESSDSFKYYVDSSVYNDSSNVKTYADGGKHTIEITRSNISVITGSGNYTLYDFQNRGSYSAYTSDVVLGTISSSNGYSDYGSYYLTNPNYSSSGSTMKAITINNESINLDISGGNTEISLEATFAAQPVGYVSEWNTSSNASDKFSSTITSTLYYFYTDRNSIYSVPPSGSLTSGSTYSYVTSIHQSYFFNDMYKVVAPTGIQTWLKLGMVSMSFILNNSTCGNLIFTPLIRLYSVYSGKTYYKDIVLVKANSSFGIGLYGVKKTHNIPVDVTMKDTRSLISERRYKLGLSITSNGECPISGYGSLDESNGYIAKTNFLNGKVTSQDLDFNLSNSQINTILTWYHSMVFSKSATETDGGDWLFESIANYYDSSQTILVGPLCTLLNLELTVNQ